YYNYSGELDFSEEGGNYHMEATMGTATLGMQYGIQWVIRNKWSIDLTVVGFGYSRSSLRGSMTTDHDDPNIGLLEDDFLQVPFIGSRFNFKGTGGRYELQEDFGTLGFRTALFIGLLF
ncbi:MAG: hypothetical protein HKN32_00105, partial [Flavobacteriales bacterium]|nr:hypothetical protein [Flavobacteriales bacterium]